MGWISDRHMKSGGSLNANSRNNGSDKGPLRKVIGNCFDKNGVEDEVLECGHTQLPVRDLIGRTNASRRRCRKCKQGKPADVDPKRYERPTDGDN